MRKLMLLFALTSGGTCLADELTVGVETTDQFPIYAGTNGQYRGFSRELLDDFASKYHHNLHYVLLPIVQLHEDFLRKKIDLKFPDNPKWQPERKKGTNIVYSEPVVIVEEGLSVLPINHGRPLTEIKRIGAIRGFTPWPFMEAIKSKNVMYAEAKDFKELVTWGLLGRVDGVYANSIAINYYLIETVKRPDAMLFDDTLPNDRSEFQLASITQPAVIAEFNDYLASNRTTIGKLKAKYHIPG
jgi:ABC-type amino acid transport substrate-binding protein